MAEFLHIPKMQFTRKSSRKYMMSKRTNRANHCYFQVFYCMNFHFRKVFSRPLFPFNELLGSNLRLLAFLSGREGYIEKFGQ